MLNLEKISHAPFVTSRAAALLLTALLLQILNVVANHVLLDGGAPAAAGVAEFYL